MSTQSSYSHKTNNKEESWYELVANSNDRVLKLPEGFHCGLTL